MLNFWQWEENYLLVTLAVGAAESKFQWLLDHVEQVEAFEKFEEIHGGHLFHVLSVLPLSPDAFEFMEGKFKKKGMLKFIVKGE